MLIWIFIDTGEILILKKVQMHLLTLLKYVKRGFAKGWNKLHPKKYHGTVSINGSADSEGIYTI